MAKGRFSSAGVVVGNTNTTRWEKRLQHQKSSKVTMGTGVPRQSEGTVGDMTVREISTLGLRCYKKTNRGWYDINPMQSAEATEWTPMRLLNSHAINTTYGEPQYLKDDLGFVHLRGGVDSGTHNDFITYLDVGFRHKFSQIRLVSSTLSSNIPIQQIAIGTDGGIKKIYALTVNSDDSIDLNTSQDICFDGISFFSGQSISSHGSGSTGGGGGGGGGGGA